MQLPSKPFKGLKTAVSSQVLVLRCGYYYDISVYISRICLPGCL